MSPPRLHLLFSLCLFSALAASGWAQPTIGTGPAVPFNPPFIDPDTYGSVSINYDWVSMEDFQPFVPDPGTNRSLTDFYWQRTAPGPNAFVSGYLRLDSGAHVNMIRFFYADTNPDLNPTFYVCVHAVDDSIGSNLTNDCSLIDSPTALTPGFSSFAIYIPPEMNPYVRSPDFRETRWILVVHIPATDGSIKFGGARAAWVREVAPAPETASFADVPTSSPVFQFVEALVSSGITAGCGGGNFCPNTPLTRGQMAVFMAKALGLHYSP